MSAEYVQEIGLESELLLLHFPTLRIRQLTLFGCESWGFVIYNQFSALVSSALACPFFFFFFCSLYPALKALTAFLCLFYRSSLPLSTSASSPLSMHCRGPSSVPQLCKQWELFTMVHHQGAPGAPPQHPRRALTTFAQVFLAHGVENYTTYERGDDPAWAKSTYFRF